MHINSGGAVLRQYGGVEKQLAHDGNSFQWKIDTNVFAIRIIFYTRVLYYSFKFSIIIESDLDTLRNRQTQFCSSCQFVKYNESIMRPLIITIIIGFRVHSKFKVNNYHLEPRNGTCVFFV